MNAQPDAHANPAKAAGERRLGTLDGCSMIVRSVPVMVVIMVPSTVVVMIVLCLGCLAREFVLMKMKPSHHQHRAE